MTRMKQMQVIATDLQAVKNLEKQECLMIVATKNQRLKELVNVPIKATGLHSKPTVEKIEDIFGQRWVETPNGGNLQVGDKVKLFDGRCNNVEAIDGGNFLIPSSDKWISRRSIQYVWC